MAISATPYNSPVTRPSRPRALQAFHAALNLLREIRDGYRQAQGMMRQAERDYPYLRFDE